MRLIPRVVRSLAVVLPLLLLSAPPVVGQATADAQQPWLYRNSDIPHDKEWNLGELDNGLRYAVRRNGVPPGQVSIRIVMDVGSLYETDSERGYAHLLEHLVFRQSKHLGNGEAIPRWQRLGATFGNDTNAETTPTQTVYKLDLPDANPAKLEESFRLLSGMMIEPTLSEANIRADVPIVLAEMRERGGAQMRVLEATQKTFFAGQRLADRLPIGTVATLQAANQQSVRAFHSRWYRPERAVIIAAGDADPATLAALVRRYFGDWKVAGKPVPAPIFGDPVAAAGTDRANPVDHVDVKVEPDLPRSITVATLRPWRQVNDTIVYNQGLMTDRVAQEIINRRLEARARRGGSFLTAQVGQQDISRSVDGTFISVTPLTADWQAALRDVRAIVADALASPPTQEEIDREVAEMEVAYQVPVEQRPLLRGAQLADDLATAFDIRETVAAPEDVLAIFRRTKPLFTPQSVHRRTRQLFSGTATRALLVTPSAGEADRAALRQALLAPVKADASVRLAAGAILFKDMPALGTPRPPAATQRIGIDAIEQVEFANGVKAMVWPTADEPGRVAVRVRFGGGYRVFEPADAPYVALGKMALVSSGVGKLGAEELDRISTGRRMGFDFQIEDANFNFSADTRQADLADQLYLLAAKFAQPRWDVNPVLRAKAATKLQYESYAVSPQGVLERELQYQQRGGDPRYRMPTPSEIDRTTPEGFRRVWERALGTGPIEVQIYGDFNRDGALAALQRTFGALPARRPLPSNASPAMVRYPTPAPTPVSLTHRGDSNQAAAVISWPTGGGSPAIRESRELEILTQLFSNRLLEAMREKSGASYAPQVISDWPLDLQNGGSVSALAQLRPEDVPVFFETARSIAADLTANPPSADELSRVTEPLRQQVTRAATGAAYFMYELRGATSDPSRIASIRTLLGDYTRTTPQRMQELAARYLAPEKGWTLQVVPQARPVVTATR